MVLKLSVQIIVKVGSFLCHVLVFPGKLNGEINKIGKSFNYNCVDDTV